MDLTIGGLDITVRMVLESPQLVSALGRLGVRIVDAAQSINDAIDRLSDTIDQEATEIIEMVKAAGMPEDVTEAIVGRLDRLGTRVRDFAPTPVVPAPEPTPAPAPPTP